MEFIALPRIPVRVFDPGRWGNDDGGSRRQAAPERIRTVRVSDAPHCSQQWVTSSRSSDLVPVLSNAGCTVVSRIRCPQWRRGSPLSLRGWRRNHVLGFVLHLIRLTRGADIFFICSQQRPTIECDRIDETLVIVAPPGTTVAPAAPAGPSPAGVCIWRPLFILTGTVVPRKALREVPHRFAA
jgi:hypothetical protein